MVFITESIRLDFFHLISVTKQGRYESIAFNKVMSL